MKSKVQNIIGLLVVFVCFSVFGIRANSQQFDWNSYARLLNYKEFQDSQEDKAYLSRVNQVAEVCDKLKKSKEHEETILYSPRVLQETFRVLNINSIDEIQFFETKSGFVVNNTAYKFENEEDSAYMSKQEIVKLINSLEDRFVCFTMQADVFDKYIYNDTTGKRRKAYKPIKINIIVNSKYLTVDDSLEIRRLPVVVSERLYVSELPTDNLGSVNKITFNYRYDEHMNAPLYITREMLLNGKRFCKCGDIIGYVARE